MGFTFRVNHHGVSKVAEMVDDNKMLTLGLMENIGMICRLHV